MAWECLRADFKESEGGSEQSCSFTELWTKENKTVNRLQKEMLKIICAYLNASHQIKLSPS